MDSVEANTSVDSEEKQGVDSEGLLCRAVRSLRQCRKSVEVSSTDTLRVGLCKDRHGFRATCASVSSQHFVNPHHVTVVGEKDLNCSSDHVSDAQFRDLIYLLTGGFFRRIEVLTF